MVRASQATTFSSESYFDDRGVHGYAQPITEYVNPHSRPIVAYYFPEAVGGFHYGQYHPMKPHRLTLVNALMIGYGLDKQIHQIYNPPPASMEELLGYHDKDYIDFLSRVTPRNQNDMRHLIDNFNCVEDCPIFADMFDFCCLYAGSSIAAARKLCAGTTDIAINWSGGLHHAKRGEASGFCYINDIVLAILELLKYHPRVLYIDIDIHHGDGVEQAFYNSNRVMTVSFHKYTGDFFPGTGKLDDNGVGLGKYFSLNVPLRDGIDDEMYLTIFKTVIEDTVTAFRPSSIVLQCGADSLGCDRLGAFNLSIAAHGECVNFVRKFNVPLLVVGGGGYTVKNVGRCWTYETAVLVGASLPDELPRTIYDPFFRDSQWKLHPPLTGKVDNQNSPASLQRITINIRSKLRYLQGAPSVMMPELPPDLERWLEEEKQAKDKEADEHPESRLDRSMAQNEFYDGNGDQDKDEEPEPEPEPEPSRRRRPTRGDEQSISTASTKSRGGRRRGRPPKTSISATPVITNISIDDETDESTPAPTSRRGRGRGRGRGRARGRKRGRKSARQVPDDVDDQSDKSEGAESEEDVEQALVPSTPNTVTETVGDNGPPDSVGAETPTPDMDMT